MSCGRAVLLAAVLSSACAPKLMTLPSGPGAPAADARDALAQATAACRGVKTLTAEMAVSGSIGGQSLHGRMLVGLASPASARIEALAPFGQPVFIFVARGDAATLLLPRDDRVLEQGRPDAVLEAAAGVPLDAADLRVTLTGCAAASEMATGRAFGDDWRVVSEGATEVYLHRNTASGPWHVASTVRGASDRQGGIGWRAEYRDTLDGLPRNVRLVSRDPGKFDLHLVLSQVDVNTTLGPDVFRVDVPRTARPITIDELRNARPGLRKN